MLRCCSRINLVSWKSSIAEGLKLGFLYHPTETQKLLEESVHSSCLQLRSPELAGPVSLTRLTRNTDQSGSKPCLWLYCWWAVSGPSLLTVWLHSCCGNTGDDGAWASRVRVQLVPVHACCYQWWGSVPGVMAPLTWIKRKKSNMKTCLSVGKECLGVSVLQSQSNRG